MTAGALFLLLITIGVVIFLAFFIPSLIAAWRTHQPSSRERELERSLEEFRELAYEYRETDAGLAYAVLDKVKELKGERRELR